jgi:hypothetical protein
MTHREKVNLVVEDLKQRGVSRYTTAPPFFRILWAAGLTIPPPLFIGFLPLMCIMTSAFAVLSGISIWIVQGSIFTLPVSRLVVRGAVTSVLFGLVRALRNRWKAQQLGLPSWEKYGEA